MVVMQNLAVATFEELEDALRGLDGRFILTGRETARWAIRTGMAGRLTVHVGEEGGGNFYEGAVHKDAIILYMPLTAAGIMNFNGHELDATSLVVVPANGLAIMKAQTANHAAMLTVPLDILRSGQRFESRDIAALASAKGVLAVDPGRLASLRRITERFAAIEEPLSASAERVAEEEFMAHILGAVTSSTTSSNPKRGRPWVSREQVLAKILALLRSAEDQILYIEDLCRVTGVSERTLRSVFNEAFGLGPIRYLRHRRLHLVRAALRAADPGRNTVAGIATEFGFWEFGRLAQEYHALFGERPSQTLGSVKHDGIVFDRKHNLTKHGPGHIQSEARMRASEHQLPLPPSS